MKSIADHLLEVLTYGGVPYLDMDKPMTPQMLVNLLNLAKKNKREEDEALEELIKDR